MQKRVVFKKGRFVVTRKGSFILKLAGDLARSLEPYCRKIKIAGSIRRKNKNPVDIDIVVIPKTNNKIKLEEFLRKKGKFTRGGEKQATFRIKGVRVELYYTTPEEFGATLLAYSSRAGAGIGLRIFAKMKGFKLNQYGLFNKNGKRIAGRTEQEIYHALGRKWKLPEKR